MSVVTENWGTLLLSCSQDGKGLSLQFFFQVRFKSAHLLLVKYFAFPFKSSETEEVIKQVVDLPVCY